MLISTTAKDARNIEDMPSYTSDDPAERLAAVREAIEKVLFGGQSYGLGGRNLTRADLPALYELEKRLMEQVANVNATGGRMSSVGRIVRP